MRLRNDYRNDIRYGVLYHNRWLLTHQRGGGHVQRVLFVFRRVNDAGYDERHDGEAQSCQQSVHAELERADVIGHLVSVHGGAADTYVVVVIVVVLPSLYGWFIVVLILEAVRPCRVLEKKKLLFNTKSEANF